MSTLTLAFATSKFRKRSHATLATAIAAFMPKSLKAARSRRATTSKSHEAQIAPLSVQVFVLKDAALLSRRPSMKTYRIAAIQGDGIGTEVVSAGIEVLHALEANGHIPIQGRRFRLGRRVLQEVWPHDAGERPQPDPRSRCDPVRLCRTSGNSGPHYAMGLAACDLSAVRSIRQRPPGAAAS